MAPVRAVTLRSVAARPAHTAACRRVAAPRQRGWRTATHASTEGVGGGTIVDNDALSLSAFTNGAVAAPDAGGAAAASDAAVALLTASTDAAAAAPDAADAAATAVGTSLSLLSPGADVGAAAAQSAASGVQDSVLTQFASLLGLDPSSAADVLAAEQADNFSLISGVPLADALLPLLSLAYATAAPGVLWGALDTYLLAPAASLLGTRIDGDEVRLSRRIGEGTFGAVYAGTYRDGTAIIAKKAKAGGEGVEQVQLVEEYFNGRLMRSIARRSCAPFLGSYSLGGLPILVWEDRGQDTLADLLEERDYMGALERGLGLSLDRLDDVARANQVCKVAMRQLIACVKDLHDDGVVHRDVKPANFILTDRGLKIIDFGAAADMRTGVNYEPKRGMLDPNYSPPEQLVMPDTTPEPPPAPIAAVLSPFLWAAFRPDLFDTYSIGLILLQLAVPGLRRRNAMGPSGTFQRSLAAADYDLRRWREQPQNRDSSVFDFGVLDYGGGLAFDLACGLVRRRNAARRGRLSCAQALLHPWLLL